MKFLNERLQRIIRRMLQGELVYRNGVDGWSQGDCDVDPEDVRKLCDFGYARGYSVGGDPELQFVDVTDETRKALEETT